MLTCSGAIFLAGLQYQQSWQSYNHHSGTVTVYLQKLTEEQSQDVFNYFLEQSDLSYGQNVLKVVIQEKV